MKTPGVRKEREDALAVTVAMKCGMLTNGFHVISCPLDTKGTGHYAKFRFRIDISRVSFESIAIIPMSLTLSIEERV